MTGRTSQLLCDELGDIKAVAAFAASLIGQMGIHGFGRDLSPEDWRGFSQVLEWMRDRLSDSETAIMERFSASDMEMLKRAGMPQEAFTDNRLRTAWRNGFSSGLTTAVKENGQ